MSRNFDSEPYVNEFIKEFGNKYIYSKGVWLENVEDNIYIKMSSRDFKDIIVQHFNFELDYPDTGKVLNELGMLLYVKETNLEQYYRLKK